MATVSIRSNLAQVCCSGIGIQNPAYRFTWLSPRFAPSPVTYRAIPITLHECNPPATILAQSAPE